MRKLLILLLIFALIPLHAQNGEAILSGVVRSEDGLDTATHFFIELFNQKTQKTYFYDSDIKDSTVKGYYEFRGLEPGIYNLQCLEWEGFHRQRILNVVLKEGFNNWYPRVKQYPIIAYKSACRRVEYYYPGSLDFEKYEEPEPLNLYPNPVRNTARLMSADFYDEVQIINLSGVLLKTIHFDEGEERIMDLSELPYGVYICKLNSSKWSVSRVIKFLKL